jgi:hypothetical protein
MPRPQKKRRWQKAGPILKKHVIELEEGFRIVAEYWWLPGKIARFAIILIFPYEAKLGYHMVCRYDTAHNFAHLDLLNQKGKVMEKVAIPSNLKYKEAFLYAQDDLKKNYKRYWEKYIEASSQSGR